MSSGRGEWAEPGQPSGRAPAGVVPAVVPGVLGRVAPRSEHATVSKARAASSRRAQLDRMGMLFPSSPSPGNWWLHA